jgi:hypothetical protein
MLYCVTSSIALALYNNPLNLLHYLKLFVMDMGFELLKFFSTNFVFANFLIFFAKRL